MSENAWILGLIPALPFFGSLLTAFLGQRVFRQQSHWPGLIAVMLSCALSFYVLADIAPLDRPALFGYNATPDAAATHAPTAWGYRYNWFTAGNVDVGITLRADGLSAIMLVTVTFVSSLIIIFSIGYMGHEREHNQGYARFFAEVSLFVASMTGLVLADNFLLLYAFWEGVGLCSFLLIGFYFTKPSAAAAARKAFLVTRLGDVGFILGIFLLWAAFQGPNGEPGPNLSMFDFRAAFAAAPAQPDWLLAAVCLLLLCGAVGKSAQFPLYVWLPDAMEGPSPVSALIHAATMVTAGVYLIARCMPLFHAAPPYVLTTVACIAAFTALLSALIALTQTDLKRVLAYSTISQIGYMFLALGSGTTDGLVLTAVLAALFHLVTHAFFKALLFLSAGSVMHAMGGVIDMRRFSGLRYALPTTHWTFLCGAGALAGVPLLSGFWSKDEILGVAHAASQGGNPHATIHALCFLAAVITVGLTAFYTFRAYFLTFWGELRIPSEAGDHAHESPPVMLVPLRILAVGAVALGIVIQPFTHWISHLLEHNWIETAFSAQPLGDHPHLGFDAVVSSGCSLLALAAIGLAWWMYVRQPGTADRLARAARGAYELSLNKFHVDELYYVFLVRPLNALAALARVFDQYVVDGIVDLIGSVPRLWGQFLRPIQNGLVQFYALAMMLGLTVFLGALVLRLTTR